MMPILEIIQTLQTLRYNQSRKITSSKYNIFQLLPCLAQHPSAFTSRCPTDKEPPPEDFYALEPPLEDFYVFHSFKPRRRQGKTNKHSSPADVKQNKRSSVYHRKIQNFSNFLPFGNDANFGSYPDAADVKTQPKSQDYLLKIQYFFNFSLVSLSIHPRSRRGAQRIRKGEGRWSRPPKTFTCFIRPSPADVKQNKRSRVCHRKIQNIGDY